MINSFLAKRRVCLTASIAVVVTIGLFWTGAGAAQEGHHHMTGVNMPMKHSDKIPPKSALQPAQGASVKIVSPKAGQVIKGDSVALEFQMKRGKVGEHIHAYIDGAMAGMFKGSPGTLNGLKPGPHVLEIRVATSDHNTELDATDRITFTVK